MKRVIALEERARPALADRVTDLIEHELKCRAVGHVYTTNFREPPQSSAYVLNSAPRPPGRDR